MNFKGSLNIFIVKICQGEKQDALINQTLLTKTFHIQNN